MRVRAIFAVFLGIFPLLVACGEPPASQPSPPDARAAGTSQPRDVEPASSAASPPGQSGSAKQADRPRIIFLGDSLTAGLGLNVADSFPSLIQTRLDREGYGFEVVNAGVSGDTSAGGLRRLEWAMADGDPKVLVVALGGNDGLRGLPPEQLEQNLATIVERAQKRGMAVILAGMEAPPNFGADYTARFREVYPRLSERYDVRLIPFLLEGVAGNPAFNQSDGIHPNQRGAAVVADLVWRALQPTLEQVRTSTSR